MYAVTQKSARYSEVCLYAITQQTSIAREFTNRLLMTEMSVPPLIISCKIHDDRSGTETGISSSFFYVLLLIILPLPHNDLPPTPLECFGLAVRFHGPAFMSSLPGTWLITV